MEDLIPVRSVKKALDILDLIIEAGMHDVDASLAGLAKRMKMPNNSAHNLLKTMVACGYVQKNGHGVYVQGLKCRQLGRLNQLAVPTLKEELLSRLRQFAGKAGEGCLLTTLVNGDRVVVARVDSTQAIQVSQATIQEGPFFARVTGRILAAHASAEALNQIIARHGMPSATWNGIKTEAALEKALSKLRQQEWDRVDTPEEGLIGLGCPVFTSEGHAWGALGLYAPAFRCPPKRSERLIKAMVQFAKTLPATLPEKFTAE